MSSERFAITRYIKGQFVGEARRETAAELVGYLVPYFVPVEELAPDDAEFARPVYAPITDAKEESR